MTKLNRKLTALELDDIRYIARNNFIDLQKGNLTEDQFRMMCFCEAVCTVLNVQGVSYPERKNCEPVDE